MSTRAQKEIRYRREMMRLQQERRFQKESFETLYSRWLTRRIGPFVVLLHILLVVFTLLWLITSVQKKIGSTFMSSSGAILGKIEIPKANKLYQFELTQDFNEQIVPLYSELEIELLNEDHSHVYSFYKDLWQEKYPDDEGRTSVYHDRKLNFIISFETPGVYYIKAKSLNNTKGDIRAVIKAQNSGSLYLKGYTIFFALITLGVIIMGSYFGYPLEIYKELKYIKNLKHNYLFIIATLCSFVLVVSVIIISISHYGYANAGEQNTLPTIFLTTEQVIYLG